MEDLAATLLGTRNGSSWDNESFVPEDTCVEGTPMAKELFKVQPWWNTAILFVGLAFFAMTFIIYMEEVFYIHKFFDSPRRRYKTVWVLALYPMYSFTALIGTLVPRAGTLSDLVGNVYFSTVLYQFVRLMIEYIGGTTHMWTQVGETYVSMRGPPCCCCCLCLPTKAFSKRLFVQLEIVVMQVALVRPCLMFIAAVLWANGSYLPGVISLTNAYIYITVLNFASTFTAVYGLLIIQKAFNSVPELHSYHLGGKFLSLQIVLILTAVINVIISILVTSEVIPCNSVLPSKTRGERIYHFILVMLMLPLSWLGRGFYRRKEEGHRHPVGERRYPVLADKDMMTSRMSLYPSQGERSVGTGPDDYEENGNVNKYTAV